MEADERCSKFWHLPTDGAGLPSVIIELHKTFSESHGHPVLVSSPLWVEADRDPATDPNNLIEPKVMRVHLMNLGVRDARNGTLRLRNPKESGGNIFAEGTVDVAPRRGEAGAALPVTAE